MSDRPVWLDQLSMELDDLKSSDLLRFDRELDGPAGPEIEYDGRKIILACSNDYLGLANDPLLKKAAVSMTKKFGSGTGAARLVSGTFSIHHELETHLAEFKNTESALVFSSGYLANLGVITSLVSRGDAVFSDELNHASIVDGCRLSGADRIIYNHCQPEHLDSLLTGTTSLYRRRLVVTDGVFSMDGDIAPLDEIASVCREHNAILMVDDAHGTGVIGEHGGGTADYFNLDVNWIVQVGTMSKAMGCLGGFVAAESEIIDYLRNKARSYFYTTSAPQGIIGAAIKAIQIIKDEPERRQKLLQSAERVRTELKKQGWEVLDGVTPIIPVIAGSAARALELSTKLLEEGILISAIRPPTVSEGSSRLRIALSSGHTEKHIKRIIEAFNKLS